MICNLIARQKDTKKEKGKGSEDLRLAVSYLARARSTLIKGISLPFGRGLCDLLGSCVGQRCLIR